MRRAYDVAIIGAGIAGLGTAAELAGRGMNVALFERAECGAATSAGSLRIMHGGMRYLQQLDFARVFQSVRAQAELLRDFPHLVKPLHCLLALEPSGLRSRIPMFAAAVLYRACRSVALRSLPAAVRLPPPALMDDYELPDAISALARPNGFFSWWDAQLLSHHALVEELLLQLKSKGGDLFNNHPIRALSSHSDRWVLCSEQGSEHAARWVIDLSGRSVGSLHPSRPFADVAWSRAFNVLLDAPMPGGEAIAFNGEHGKSFFLVGRDDHSALGTGYLPCTGVFPIRVESEEVESFLEDARTARPELAILHRPIVQLEVGSIPVRMWQGKRPSFFGLDRIFCEGRYIAAMVTKYTTFRVLAKKIARLCES